MNQKQPKIFQTEGDLNYSLFSDHRSNGKRFYIKYHRKILSYSR